MHAMCVPFNFCNEKQKDKQKTNPYNVVFLKLWSQNIAFVLCNDENV